MGGLKWVYLLGFWSFSLLSSFSGTLPFCFNAANMECPCLGLEKA